MAYTTGPNGAIVPPSNNSTGDPQTPSGASADLSAAGTTGETSVGSLTGGPGKALNDGEA